MGSFSSFRTILSARSNHQGTTFSYRGKGYAYHLHKTAKDIWVKLQMSRQTMDSFIKWCWKNARRTLPAINICHQGSSWFDIFTMDDSKLFTVINFVKTLNKWMNGAFEPHPVDRRHYYFVEARKFIHSTPYHTYQTSPSRSHEHSNPNQQPIPLRERPASIATLSDVAQVAPTFYQLGLSSMFKASRAV